MAALQAVTNTAPTPAVNPVRAIPFSARLRLCDRRKPKTPCTEASTARMAVAGKQMYPVNGTGMIAPHTATSASSPAVRLLLALRSIRFGVNCSSEVMRNEEVPKGYAAFGD
jgi:hypothetical protein